jgi:hypothetical protein
MTVEERLLWLQQRIATSDIASAGKLSTEQLNKFIQLIVDNTALKDFVFTDTMKSMTKDLDNLDIATRQLSAPTEGTDPETSISATFAKRTLTALEWIYPVDLTYSFIEDNIEKLDIEMTIMDLCAIAIALDLEDLNINGDTGSGVTFTAQNDGWIKIAKSAGHVFDIESPDERLTYIFPGMLKDMPDKWKANRSELAFLCSQDDYEEYEDEIATRNTALGDMIVTTGKRVPYKGIEIKSPPSWPAGTYMLTRRKNLSRGVYRDMLLEKQRAPRKRVLELTYSGRQDAEIRVVDAVVIGYQAS